MRLTNFLLQTEIFFNAFTKTFHYASISTNVRFPLLCLLALLFLLLLHLLDLGRVPLVLLALRVHVVEVEHAHDVLLLEHELLDLAAHDGGDAADLEWNEMITLDVHGSKPIALYRVKGR